MWNEAKALRTTAGDRISRGRGVASADKISPCGSTRRNSEWSSRVCATTGKTTAATKLHSRNTAPSSAADREAVGENGRQSGVQDLFPRRADVVGHAPVKEMAFLGVEQQVRG